MLAVTSCSVAKSAGVYFGLADCCSQPRDPLCHTYDHRQQLPAHMFPTQTNSYAALRASVPMRFSAFLMNISVLMSYRVPVVTSVNTSGSINVNEAGFFHFFFSTLTKPGG